MQILNFNFSFRTDFLESRKDELKQDQNDLNKNLETKNEIDLGKSLRGDNNLAEKTKESEKASKNENEKEDSLATIYSLLKALYTMLEQIQKRMQSVSDPSELSQLNSQAQQIMGKIMDVLSKLAEILEKQQKELEQSMKNA